MIEEECVTQRRQGLHTETPGCVCITDTETNGGEWQHVTSPPTTIRWGRGSFDTTGANGRFVGGLFMASSVGKPTRVWNAKVKDPAVVGRLGSVEHIRPALGNGYVLNSGELVWMTDLIPHEALPLKKGTYRQYFRLVTDDISVWYSQHSTPNPLGIEPPKYIRIIRTNKFE